MSHIAHWLLMHGGKNIWIIIFWSVFAWGVYYAGFRWNASDESFLHRGGGCNHTHNFCDPPGEKTW